MHFPSGLLASCVDALDYRNRSRFLPEDSHVGNAISPFRPQTTRRPVAESVDGYGQRRFHGVIEGRMRQSSFFDFPGDSVIQVHVGRVGNAVGQAVEGKLREFADFYTERFKVVTARTKVLGINALELKRENPKSTFTTSTARITTPNSRFPN